MHGESNVEALVLVGGRAGRRQGGGEIDRSSARVVALSAGECERAAHQLPAARRGVQVELVARLYRAVVVVEEVDAEHTPWVRLVPVARVEGLPVDLDGAVVTVRRPGGAPAAPGARMTGLPRARARRRA